MSVGALGAGNQFPEKSVIVVTGSVTKEVKVTAQPAPYRFINEIAINAPEGKSASLTFGAGVVAQMSETASISVGYSSTGHVKIAGTAEKPVTFTRYGEDPKATPWKGMTFWSHARAPQIEHAVFEYAGSKEEPVLKFETEALGLGSIAHTTFKHVPGDAIVVHNVRERFTAFDNNTFEDVGGASLTTPLYFAHNLGTANKLTYVRIFEGAGEDVTLKAIGAPYQLEGEIAFNGAGAKSASLTLEPGVALRFIESGTLAVGYSATAKLVAKGTAEKPITFASASEGQKWQGLVAWSNGTLEPRELHLHLGERREAGHRRAERRQGLGQEHHLQGREAGREELRQGHHRSFEDRRRRQGPGEVRVGGATCPGGGLMKRWMLAMAGCLATTGCVAAQAAEPDAVWMFRNFSWGKQCEGKVTGEPSKGTAGAPGALPDAGAQALEQQVTACFQGKAAPAAAVDCAVKAVTAAGVSVREKRTETMSVCEACNCPANALRLHLLVMPRDQKALEAAGFKVRSRPPPPPE
ncbi:MAG: hypothetical protein QM765_09065 [Myxococcales bacterium]